MEGNVSPNLHSLHLLVKLKMFALRWPPCNTIRHCPCCVSRSDRTADEEGGAVSLLDPPCTDVVLLGKRWLHLHANESDARQNCHQQHRVCFCQIAGSVIVEKEHGWTWHAFIRNVSEFAKMTVRSNPLHFRLARNSNIGWYNGKDENLKKFNSFEKKLIISS